MPTENNMSGTIVDDMNTAVAHALSSPALADAGLCPVRTQRMMGVLQAEIDVGRLPGAVLLVARRGKVAVFEALGQQNPDRGIPMRKDAIFRIYSMTKPIVSVAVMMLVEQGRLLLSDVIAQHLPEYAGQCVPVPEVDGGGATGASVARSGSRPSRQDATVQDLLRHTAGLTYEFLGDAPVQQAYARMRMGRRTRTNADFSAALGSLPLMFEPGSVWEYSRATDVLGRLIEVISGQTLGDFLQSHILVPLGMVDTAFHVPPTQHHRIAEPFAHDPDGGTPMVLFDPRERALMESGGGGLMSTAGDYAKFLQFMLNLGELNGVRLLGSRTVKFMTADHLGGIPVNGTLLPAGHGFGLGFAVRTETGVATVPGSVGLYYWGGIAGTTFFVDPKEDLFAMLLIQAPNQRDYYRPLFRSLVYACLTD